ncbi:MAG: hypothetical protein LBU73_07965 [Helicobacteraceae bacterium]|jgi:hypothetical protein|nr:hypothetical protein [Helicobacteraceae bacterium]
MKTRKKRIYTLDGRKVYILRDKDRERWGAEALKLCGELAAVEVWRFDDPQVKFYDDEFGFMLTYDDQKRGRYGGDREITTAMMPNAIGYAEEFVSRGFSKKMINFIFQQSSIKELEKLKERGK